MSPVSLNRDYDKPRIERGVDGSVARIRPVRIVREATTTDAAVQGLVNDTASNTRGALETVLIPTAEKGAIDGVATLDAAGALVQPVPPANVEGGVVQPGDLVVNAVDYATIQAAIDAAATLGRTCWLPGGTHTIDTALTTPAGFTALIGAPGAILRRSTTSTATRILTVSVDDATVEGITFDGNKAANANPCHTLMVANVARVTIRNNTFINAKASGGWGNGLNVDGVLLADDTLYVIEGNRASDCDTHGIAIAEASNGLIAGNTCYANGSAGLFINNFDATFTQKVTYLRVQGNLAHSNGTTGIVVGNFIENNDTVNPDYGFGNSEATAVTVVGNTVRNNAQYGIACNGLHMSITGNVAIDNSTSSGAYAGILASVDRSTITGNVCISNGRGIEFGGVRNSVAAGNLAENNPTVGMSCGASINFHLVGNFLQNNGGTSGAQITCDRYDSADNTRSFDWEGTGITIEGNRIILSGSQVGVKLESGVPASAIRGNHFQGGSSLGKYISDHGNGTVIEGNTIPGSSGVGISPDGSNRLYIPDVLCGSPTFSAILSASATVSQLMLESAQTVGNGTGVAWVNVTGFGSGYTSQPTVSFSGGGGTGAAATSMITKDGRMVGVRMTAHGTGYTSAPTVSFSGGGGTGATATAQHGLPVGSKNRIRIQQTAGTSTIASASGAAGVPGVTHAAGAITTTLEVRDVVEFRANISSWLMVGGTSGRYLGSNTVASLPAAAAGSTAYASDGRKSGEGAGAGTGVQVYRDGSSWRRVSDDTTVVA